MNALMSILAYRHHGGWSFDDEAVGLVAEPFVAGIPEMIDILADQVSADGCIVLTFASAEFPSASLRLDRIREEFGGNWYRWEDRGMDGWLCPALLKYFPIAPDKIWIGARLPR